MPPGNKPSDSLESFRHVADNGRNEVQPETTDITGQAH